MGYSITTRDGITVQNIPDDVPPDDPSLKERVARARRAREANGPQPSAPSNAIPARQQTVTQPEPVQGFIPNVSRALSGEGRKQPGQMEIGSIPTPVETPFDINKPGTWFDDTSRRWATAAGWALDPRTESRARIIQQNYPRSQFRRDEFGNLQARFNPEGQWGYVNEPGFSMTDGVTLATEVAKYVPAAKLAAGGATLAGRAALAAAGSGATRVASDSAAMLVGGTGPTVEDTAITAGLSGAFQGGADLIRGGTQLASALRPFVTGTRPAARATETVAPVVASAADDEISAAAQAARQADMTASQRAVQQADEARASYAEADEFGVPLTRGQARGDPRQIAQEQRWARGGASEGAERVMRAHVERQAGALEEAGKALAARGNQPLTQSLDDAGQQFRDSLVTRREALQVQADKAYDKAFEAARQEGVAASDELAATVRGVVDDEFLQAPQALSVIDRLQDLIKQGKANFGHVERARQALNRLAQTAADSQDNATLYAVQRIKQSLDEWAANSMRTPAARQTFDESREIFSDLKQLYGSSGARDAGGRAIERVMDLDRTGQQIVDSVLGVGARPTQATLAAVKRIKEISTSTTKDGRIAQRAGATRGAKAFNSETALPAPELQTIREAVIYKVLQPLANRPAGGALPAQSIAANLRRALDGEGKEIMAELFTKTEIALLRRYLKVVERLVPPAGSVNYSGTAYEISRMLQAATDALAGGIGGFMPRVMGMITGQAGKVFQGQIGEASEAVAAQVATRKPTVIFSPNPDPARVVYGGTGATNVQREDVGLSGNAPPRPYIDPYTGAPAE